MPVAVGSVELHTPVARRAVRAERAEVVRWRRLLRARLDLLVATYAPPEPLGETGWDVLPHPSFVVGLSDQLREAVGDVAEADRVAAMRRLRELDKMLAAYADELDTVLDTSTERLVMELISGELARSAELG